MMMTGRGEEHALHVTVFVRDSQLMISPSWSILEILMFLSHRNAVTVTSTVLRYTAGKLERGVIVVDIHVCICTGTDSPGSMSRTAAAQRLGEDFGVLCACWLRMSWEV